MSITYVAIFSPNPPTEEEERKINTAIAGATSQYMAVVDFKCDKDAEPTEEQWEYNISGTTVLSG
ncbi:hypothetical protein [Agarilytica rhodophyticola]|uniref:hypothetical protein n=1 Tax=Agarilytica rhodophyticola TaxID=1737490 RepID=UPI000B347E66|nr:hypothetical protein [Agarilytica rhodophyticola]